MTDGESPAGSQLRVDARRSGIGPGRWVKAGVVNLVSAVTVGSMSSWPPIDVTLVDTSSGRTLRVWHEGGDQAATLVSVLNEDLAALGLDQFLEKWDVRLA